MRRCLTLALLLLAPLFAHAAPTLDQIRQHGVLRCAGVVRPGLAFPGADQAWHGLEIELCRAVAVAALGPDARIEFRGLYAPATFEALRQGEEGLLFLTPQETADNRVAADVHPIAPVFNEPEQVMLPARDPAQHVGELSGKMICFEPGARADRDLDQLVADRRMHVFYGPFFEAEEMLDAFNVGRCDAIVGEATALAALKFSIGKDKQPVRLLPEFLSTQPVLAATPAKADDAWQKIVGSVLQTVIAGQPADLHMPGLDPGWQGRVLTEVGAYDTLFRELVGAGSPLGLASNAGVQPASR